MGSNLNRWNKEKMQEHCDNLKNGYIVLDVKRVKKSYQNVQMALMKCPNKNHEAYWVSWNQFRRGFYCKQCDYDKKGKITWNNNKAFEFFISYGYKMLDLNDWKNVDKTVWCTDKDGFKVRPSITNLRSNIKPSYLQYNKFALDNIKLYCKLFRPDYCIKSEQYIDCKTKYKWEYIGDGLPMGVDSIFIQTVDGFINGGCGHPYFTKSNGNKIFENELIRYGIPYEKEKTFDGCKDIKKLRFDFYLPLSNEIIEIDGLQHNEIIEYFGGIKGYKDRIKKDNIKNDYCNKNNIKITRIPYKTNKQELFKNDINFIIQQIVR